MAPLVYHVFFYFLDQESWLLLLTVLVFQLLSLVNHLPDELAPVLEHKLGVDALPEVPVAAALQPVGPFGGVQVLFSVAQI